MSENQFCLQQRPRVVPEFPDTVAMVPNRVAKLRGSGHAPLEKFIISRSLEIVVHRFQWQIIATVQGQATAFNLRSICR